MSPSTDEPRCLSQNLKDFTEQQPHACVLMLLSPGNRLNVTVVPCCLYIILKCEVLRSSPP